MAERQVDIDMAMHDLGQRLRETWNKNHVVPVGVLEVAKHEARNQWEIERQNERDLGMHQPQSPQIEAASPQPKEPEIEP